MRWTLPGLAPDYGEQPIPCIDLWIHYEVDHSSLRADVEGSDVATWLRRRGRTDLASTLTATPLDTVEATRALAAGLELMLGRDAAT